MSTYPLGTVADATVRGQSSYRVMLVASPYGSVWVHSEIRGINSTRSEEVTDIRPLVVLDLEPALDHMGGGMSDLPEVLKDMRRGGGIFADRIADQIEAQVAPPRIPEPTWSGVVEAHTAQNSDRLRWQRDSGSHSEHWVCEDTLEYDRPWDALIDPTLVRHGIGDES